MSRKTAYEKEHMTLQKKQGNNKDTKKRVWQHLFINKPKHFSADKLGVILGVDRTTVSKALNKLVGEKPTIERGIEYKVYKIDKEYCVLSKEQYEKHKNKTIDELIQIEADELDNPKIWTAKEAEDLHAEVIFYPIAKDSRYFIKVTKSLKKLFGEYIIAVLAGDKDGNTGLFIILKPHKNVGKIKEHIKDLYEEAAI